MKMIEQFKDFLETTVNLNQSRHDRINYGITVVENFLKKHDDFKDIFVSVTPQGSTKHETLIKPVRDNDEFDVDILFLLEKQHGWRAKQYLDTLHDAFAKTELYKNKVDKDGKRRCVTIDYESDFHIDIVPCFLNKKGQYQIMNRSTNKFELTDGEGYANWFKGRDEITGNNLREVIKIAKYLRDYKTRFSVKSILLTTLLGMQVQDNDNRNRDYPDVPTSLKTLFNRLDKYLQDNEKIPDISNPILDSEKFTRHWDKDKYSNFRDKIHYYTEKINAAFDSKDEYESARLWTELFGDSFEIPQEESKQKDVSLSPATYKEYTNAGNDEGAKILAAFFAILAAAAAIWGIYKLISWLNNQQKIKEEYNKKLGK